MSEHDCVLIAGGGPVGTVTGLRLAQLGIPVKIFDRLDQPAEDHRAATLQPSTLDLFETIGITPEILRLGLKSPVFQWRDRVSGEVVAEFDYGVLAGESQYPYVIQLEQHRTVYVALAEYPSPLNPLGVKGVGESGCVPAAGAIVSAVEHALAPFGVRITEYPMTPARLFASLHAPQAL